MKWLREYIEAKRLRKFYALIMKELKEQGKTKTIFVIDGVCEDCPGPDWCDCDQGIDCD